MLLANLRLRRAFGILLTLCGISLVFGAMWLARDVTPVSARLEPLRRVTTPTNDIALTFDISWGTEMPTKVADILRDYEIQATIFISGPWASRNIEFVRRLADEGHELASHGYRHHNMGKYDAAQIIDSVTRTHEILRGAGGQEPRFIRPPNGDYDDLVISTAAALGYTVVIWSLDSLDWLNPGVDRIVERVLGRATPGDIILLHASDTCKQTDLALPRVLEGLAAQGLRPVPLGELIRRAQMTQ